MFLVFEKLKIEKLNLFFITKFKIKRSGKISEIFLS